jgi:hypothetical protein
LHIKTFLLRLRKARQAVDQEITGNGSSGDKFARGLANEGYAGGYRQALEDVEAMLRHGYPGDPRRYWA